MLDFQGNPYLQPNLKSEGASHLPSDFFNMKSHEVWEKKFISFFSFYSKYHRGGEIPPCVYKGI